MLFHHLPLLSIDSCLLGEELQTIDTMGFYTGSAKDKEYTEQKAQGFVDRASEYGGFNLTRDHTVDSIGRYWFKPFLNVDRVLDNWDYFGNLKGGWNSRGLSAYPTPSTTEYQQCKEGDGVSAWDDKGWWRCLFPSKSNYNDELSYSDVSNDSENKHGLFFKDYNSLMDWNLEMRKLVKQKYDETIRFEKERENIQQIYDEHAKDLDFDLPAVEKDNTKVSEYQNGYTSSSKSVRIRTLDNGDIEEITEIHQRFPDGSKEKKKFRKLIPKDGEPPVLEDLSNENKSGWIWNK